MMGIGDEYIDTVISQLLDTVGGFNRLYNSL